MSGEDDSSGKYKNLDSEAVRMGRRMNFYSIYSHGFARFAACTIVSSVADPTSNAGAILDAARVCHQRSVAVAVFPELCLSGYAIEDLPMQDALLDATERAAAAIVEASVDFMTVLVVGAPLRNGSRIYNCAMVIHRGESWVSCRKPICRHTGVLMRPVTSDRAAMRPAPKSRSVRCVRRSAPTCCSKPMTSRGSSSELRSVRICGYRSRPDPNWPLQERPCS